MLTRDEERAKGKGHKGNKGKGKGKGKRMSNIHFPERPPAQPERSASGSGAVPLIGIEHFLSNTPPVPPEELRESARNQPPLSRRSVRRAAISCQSRLHIFALAQAKEQGVGALKFCQREQCDGIIGAATCHRIGLADLCTEREPVHAASDALWQELCWEAFYATALVR